MALVRSNKGGGSGAISEYKIKVSTNPTNNDVVAGQLELTSDMIGSFTQMKMTIGNNAMTGTTVGYVVDGGNLTNITDDTVIPIPAFTTSLFVYVRGTTDSSHWGDTDATLTLS